MRRWTKREREAIEAVARHLRGTWEDGDGAGRGFLALDGRRIALAVAALTPPVGDRPSPRLRFDRVVLSLAERLKRGLADAVPDGNTVIITVTAPIRQPAATAEALEASARAVLKRPARRAKAAAIHGNQTRIRLVMARAAGAAKVAVYVHNPDDGAASIILDAAQALIEGVSAADLSGEVHGERWLVLAGEGGPQHFRLVRQILAEAMLSDGFGKALLVTAGGRVGE